MLPALLHSIRASRFVISYVHVQIPVKKQGRSLWKGKQLEDRRPCMFPTPSDTVRVQYSSPTLRFSLHPGAKGETSFYVNIAAHATLRTGGGKSRP